MFVKINHSESMFTFKFLLLNHHRLENNWEEALLLNVHSPSHYSCGLKQLSSVLIFNPCHNFIKMRMRFVWFKSKTINNPQI